MSKKFQRALFIFRRDLRLDDNTALIEILKHSKEVVPCFIFTPEQIAHNPYRGDHALQFMIESLEDLKSSLKAKKTDLYFFQGKPQEVIETCIKELKIDAVAINRDYTPYSVKRDHSIQMLCKKHEISFQSFDDALLHPPEETLKADQTPYKIFTPFYKNASRLEVAYPRFNHYDNYYTQKIGFSIEIPNILKKRTLPPSGGRSAGFAILKTLKHFTHYESLRDFPDKQATTHLSAHLKFTTCSPREVYHAIVKQLGPSSELIRSLYWRDFFTSIAFYFPQVFSGAFHEEFNQIQWSQDQEAFTKWCEGRTGFPIVDAGMRELNQTGFMQNRARMIAGSFLVKDLHIDWRWGEKYFAQKLIDYDPAINNGNWQWVASTGCDAQPYFRVFNPWTQSLKFDPECLYIKQWVPELADLPAAVIHKWHEEKHHEKCSSYPPPMLDHSKESKKAIALYKKT